MSLTLLLALSSLAPDPYEVAHVAARNQLYRTCYVLVQELAYRSKNTAKSQMFFGSLRRSLPQDALDPPYTFGYLWPHWTRSIVKSPYETLQDQERRRRGIEDGTFDFAPWSILRAPDECLAALRLEGYRRTLEPGSAAYGATSRPDVVGAQVGAVLSAAETLDSRRLVAALVCDLSDRKDLEGLRSVQRWAGFKAIADECIPPGCDTLDVDWRAFRAAVRGRGRNIEMTFRDLLERGIVLSTPERSDESARFRGIRALEKIVAPEELTGPPLRASVELLCLEIGAEDHTRWDALETQSVFIDNIDFVRWGKVPARGALQKMVYAAAQDELRVSVDERGGVALVPTKASTSASTRMAGE